MMDPNQDWLLRMIYNLADGMRACSERGARMEIPKPTNDISDDDMLPEILQEMIAAGKLDEAENLLFVCVKNYPLAENYIIGLNFYEALTLLPEEELSASGWSREEIKEGLADLHQMIFHEPLDFTGKEKG